MKANLNDVNGALADLKEGTRPMTSSCTWRWPTRNITCAAITILWARWPPATHCWRCLVTAFPPSGRQLNEYGLHLARELRKNPLLSLTIVGDELSACAWATDAQGKRLEAHEELPEFEVTRTWKFNSIANPYRVLKVIREIKPDVVWYNLVFSTFATQQHPVAAYARLVIAGANHHTMPGYWESIAEKHRGNPGVEFRGYVPEEEIPDLYSTASVVVLPYDSSTGSSGPAHQACQYGLPIVSSDLPEFLDMAGRRIHGGGFLPSR